MTFREKLGARIKAARQARGLSLRELADRMPSVSHSAIGRWERGVGEPSVVGLFHIARALGRALRFFLVDLEEELLATRSLEWPVRDLTGFEGDYLDLEMRAVVLLGSLP